MNRDVQRRRVRFLSLGLALIGMGALGGLGGSAVDGWATRTFGTGAVDDALDAGGIDLDATIMTSESTSVGWIVSYEYYFGPTYEVGYQRLPPQHGQRLGFGTPVQIEAVEHALEARGFPASSRLKGTVREPRAGVTRTLSALRPVREVLAVGCVGLGLGLGIWGWRRS